MEYEVEGGTGRPKKTWREIVEKDCQARKLNREDAVDCNGWRKQIGMIDDHDECEWVNVSSGIDSPVLSWRAVNACVCVCVCSMLKTSKCSSGQSLLSTTALCWCVNK